jgi:hypothetical protein
MMYKESYDVISDLEKLRSFVKDKYKDDEAKRSQITAQVTDALNDLSEANAMGIDPTSSPSFAKGVKDAKSFKSWAEKNNFNEISDFKFQNFFEAQWSALKRNAKQRFYSAFNVRHAMSALSGIVFATLFTMLATWFAPESISTYIPLLAGVGSGWLSGFGYTGSALLGVASSALQVYFAVR